MILIHYKIKANIGINRRSRLNRKTIENLRKWSMMTFSWALIFQLSNMKDSIKQAVAHIRKPLKDNLCEIKKNVSTYMFYGVGKESWWPWPRLLMFNLSIYHLLAGWTKTPDPYFQKPLPTGLYQAYAWQLRPTRSQGIILVTVVIQSTK